MKRLTKDRKKKDGDTEQRILDAAHAVFVRRGTAGARMQEIAAEAGVNQALLHYYFRNKEQLAQAAFERAAKGFMPAVVAGDRVRTASSRRRCGASSSSSSTTCRARRICPATSSAR